MTRRALALICLAIGLSLGWFARGRADLPLRDLALIDGAVLLGLLVAALLVLAFGTAEPPRGPRR